MADVDDLESLDTDIRNMTISKIGDVIGSYSIEISDFDCLSELSHHPSRECFMVQLELNNHLGNNDNGVIAVAGNIKDNLSIFQSVSRSKNSP